MSLSIYGFTLLSFKFICGKSWSTRSGECSPVWFSDCFLMVLLTLWLFLCPYIFWTRELTEGLDPIRFERFAPDHAVHRGACLCIQGQTAWSLSFTLGAVKWWYSNSSFIYLLGTSIKGISETHLYRKEYILNSFPLFPSLGNNSLGP